MNGLLGPMMVIVWKDLLLELRSKDLVVSIVVFGLLVVVVFNFALNNTPGMSEELAPGILWAAFAFSAILAMNRAFVRDQEQGGLELQNPPVRKRSTKTRGAPPPFRDLIHERRARAPGSLEPGAEDGVLTQNFTNTDPTKPRSP